MREIQKFYSFSAKGKSKLADIEEGIALELISEQEPFEYKFTEDECEDRNNTIHDSYLDIYNISLDNKQIKSIAKSLPEDINIKAAEWGWNDTVVGDQVYLFLNAYPDILDWEKDRVRKSFEKAVERNGEALTRLKDQ